MAPPRTHAHKNKFLRFYLLYLEPLTDFVDRASAIHVRFTRKSACLRTLPYSL